VEVKSRVTDFRDLFQLIEIAISVS